MYCYVLKLKEYLHYGIGKSISFKIRKSKYDFYLPKDYPQKVYNLKDIRKYKHKIIKIFSNQLFSQKILKEMYSNKYDMCVKNGYYNFYKRGSKAHIKHKVHNAYRNACFKECNWLINSTRLNKNTIDY